MMPNSRLAVLLVQVYGRRKQRIFV